MDRSWSLFNLVTIGLINNFFASLIGETLKNTRLDYLILNNMEKVTKLVNSLSLND